MFTDKAKDGDVVAFVKNAESAKNLIQRRTTGRNVIDYQNVLLMDGSTQFLINRL